VGHDVAGEQVQRSGRDIGRTAQSTSTVPAIPSGRGSSRRPSGRQRRCAGRRRRRRIGLGGEDPGARTPLTEHDRHRTGPGGHVEGRAVRGEQIGGTPGQRLGLPAGHVDAGIDQHVETTEGVDPTSQASGSPAVRRATRAASSSGSPATRTSSTASSSAATQPAAARMRTTEWRSPPVTDVPDGSAVTDGSDVPDGSAVTDGSDGPDRPGGSAEPSAAEE